MFPLVLLLYAEKSVIGNKILYTEFLKPLRASALYLIRPPKIDLQNSMTVSCL